MSSMFSNYRVASEMYFEALNEKDLDKLEKLYHRNVELHDWNGSWYDSPVVLDFNERLFDEGLEFELVESNQFEDRTYNHILIHTSTETLKVIDVLYFDEDFKITKIEAFKG